MSTINSFNNELSEETSSDLNNECSFNDYIYENDLNSSSITKLCFNDQNYESVQSESVQSECLNELVGKSEEIKENLDDKLHLHFQTFLQSLDCVYDSKRNLWVDVNGKYDKKRWDWKDHNIWKCKYREWVRKNYYIDTIGNIVPTTKEQKDNITVSKKVYFDKKTGDIVEKELVFDGQKYQTVSNEDTDKSLLTNEDIFGVNSTFRKNKVCEKCKEEEKKMIEKEEAIQSEMLNTSLTIPLTSLETDEELTINNILWGDSEEIDRLLTHFNIKTTPIEPKGLSTNDILDKEELSDRDKEKIEKIFKKEVFYINNRKKNHLPNYEEKKAYFGNPYENKNEVDYFTQDEMLTKYNETELNNLISVLKCAPYEHNYQRIPTKNRLQSLKRDIKPSFIEYMFESCFANSIKSGEPGDQEKEVYKSIFNEFSSLFSETNTEEWEVSLKNV